MKLFQVWNAQAAFKRLADLKKPPKLAYRLLTYSRKFDAEAAICEAHRIACVYAIAGAEPGTVVELNQGTPEFDTFFAKFNEFLSNESDLEPVGLDMDALIDGLDAEKGNVLSENDLALLDPFFTVRPSPELKLVPAS